MFPQAVFRIFPVQLLRAWLNYFVWAPFVVTTLIIFIARFFRNSPPFGGWCWDRIKPILWLGGCFLIAFSAAIISDAIELGTKLPQQHGAGTVSGPDLIVNLLTISALTASAGFAYLCLPSDRAEMRVAAMTKDTLLSFGIEAESYAHWYEALPLPEKTPARKLLYGLLSPRDVVGGWYLLKVEDFNEAVGADVWRRFARYADEHLDDAWVRMCLYCIAFAIGMGLLCLFWRYFGISQEFFNPVEFSVIVLLVCVNFVIAYLIISLAVGVHVSEAAVRDIIKKWATEQKPAVVGWLASRSEALVEDLRAKAATRVADPDDPPPGVDPSPATNKRGKRR
jgi:hypothetical protein